MKSRPFIFLADRDKQPRKEVKPIRTYKENGLTIKVYPPGYADNFMVGFWNSKGMGGIKSE